MTTPPYRTDLEILNDRRAQLQTELDGLRAEADRLGDLRAREQEVARELAEVERDLGMKGRRRLGVLDNLRIASPCSANWEEMVGDERVRFCTSCDKHVFNLSAMGRDEAEALLEKDGSVCVRYYQRADGTVMTEDCPVGVRRKRRRRIAVAAAGAAALAASALHLSSRSTTMGAIHPTTMGEPVHFDAPRPTEVANPDKVTAPDPPQQPMMGAVAPVAPPVPQKTPKTPKANPHPTHTMGRPARP